MKVLRRRERRILFGIEELNAGKSLDLSSIRDDEPRAKDSLAARMTFTTGCCLFGRPNPRDPQPLSLPPAGVSSLTGACPTGAGGRFCAPELRAKLKPQDACIASTDRRKTGDADPTALSAAVIPPRKHDRLPRWAGPARGALPPPDSLCSRRLSGACAAPDEPLTVIRDEE